MITLITGSPGSGKTAWIVNELFQLKNKDKQRNVYVHGIKKLKIPHLPIYCKSPLCDICRSKTISDDALYVEDWSNWFEPGSLIIVDECQRIWRTRGPSQKPPESVTALETHRHHGLDFWIISQAPNLFDKSVRMLVNRHIHLVSNWRGRTQYEWSECREDVSRRNDAVVRDYKLPSNIYPLYHSAEIHTKINKRRPLSFYFAIAALASSVSLGYFVFQRISNRNHDDIEKPFQVSRENNDIVDPQLNATYPDFKPVIPGVPESAPAYSHLIKVTEAPILAGCIKSRTECKCYTGQATPYPTSIQFCEEFVKGRRFNPFLDRNNQNERGLLEARSRTSMVTPPTKIDSSLIEDQY